MAEIKEKKKKGRPTNNPKGNSIHVRLDNECVEILEKYQTKYNENRAVSIRRGIRKLKEDL